MAIAHTSAAEWDGTAWHVMHIVQKGVSGLLYAIACPGTASCVAVGTQDTGGGDSFGEVWNGTTWTDNGPGNECATYPEGRLCAELSISCASLTFCLAVGAEQIAEDDPTGDSQIWNGTGWSQTQPPPELSLSGVSCVTPSFCLGLYTIAPATVAVWNGAEWKDTTGPGGLVSIWCVRTSFCMAVTRARVAQQWNGTGWRQLPIPQPAGRPAHLRTVTCRSAVYCVAVGSYKPAIGGSRTLSELWNGTNWQVSLPPSPS
jgi:hypothetical protein